MHIRRFVLPALTILAASTLLTAGPLDPPSGAIVPTYKTLTEVEPRTPINPATAPGDADSVYRITKPGSYYLVESMVAPAGKAAIEIDISNVTIDLNGFTISSIATLPAIHVPSGNRYNITVRNGHIGNCFGDGINLSTGSPAAEGGLIENISVSGTVGVGIKVLSGFIISNCSVTDAGQGYASLHGNTFINCAAYKCRGSGFVAQGHTTFENCVSAFNDAFGIYTGSGSTITNCVANGNDQLGFSADRCVLADSSAYFNGANGFSVGGSTLNNCFAHTNDGDGFEGQGATFVNCKADSNGGSGFVASTTNVIDCFASSNDQDGILVTAYSVIRGNRLSGNDRAGIYVDGTGSRILQNSMTNNVYGIRVLAANNIITSNTAGFNTTSNWYIVANNSVGPIIKTNKTASLINGDTAAGTMGSSDSNANFTY